MYLVYFMDYYRMDESETDLLDFLRCLPELKGYPLHKLPKNKPTLFAFTYFRIGMVICSDSRKNDYIIIIKSVRFKNYC